MTAVLLLGWFAIPATDTDTWWHLKTGQYVLERHALPVPDPFAYTTSLNPPASHGEALARDFNLTHEWLAQCIFYLVYAAGGFAGLILFRAFLLAAFCGVVGWVVFHRTGGFYRSIAAAIAAAGVASWSTADRPFLFTYLFLAITVAVFESRRGWWLLPPLFAVWANLHGGFFMGWVVAACYGAEGLYSRWRGQAHGDERRMWIASAAAILATGLNPNGFRFIEVLLAYRASPMQAQLFEWQHPKFWELSWFDAVLWGGAATLIWARRRVRIVDWLLFGLFAAASLQAVRNVTLMALIGPIVIATYAGWRATGFRRTGYWVAALLVAGVLGEVGWRHGFELHAATSTVPAGAANFILAHDITGRIFNTYEEGGYLIWRLWPQQRVFIDGRALDETAYRDATRIEFNADATGGPSAEQLLKRYGVEVIVMNCFQPNTAAVYLLPAALADPAQHEWKLVYRDAQAVIYMRHPPPDVPTLNSLEALDSMSAQCENVLKDTPGAAGCARSLGLLLARIGYKDGALRWLATYRERAASPDSEVDAVFRGLSGRR